MRILVISEYYYPEDFRINDICETLAARGHEVTVVAGIPNYPKGIVFEGYEDSYKRPQTINGVKVYRCHNKPRKRGLINLAINYVGYVRKAKRILKKLDGEFDVVYAYQMSPIIQVNPAIMYKKKHHLPLYIYVCDLWPESALDLGKKRLSKRGPLYSFLLRASKKIYGSGDALGVKCKEFIDYLSDTCGVDKKKCFVNFEHAEQFYLDVNDKPRDNGVIDFMFLGNMGHASNCQMIIQAAAKLKRSGFLIHFVGFGSEYENLVAMTKELGLESVVLFHGRVPQSNISEYYDLADICLLTLKGDSPIGLTPPAKLTSYMASSRPIIASVDGASHTIIEEAGCGWACSADDVDGLARLMQTAIDHPESIYACGSRGRQYFKEHFTVDQHIAILEKHLEALIRNNENTAH